MKKKLFKNYEYTFDKNQAKIITSFAKQAVKQMETDNNLAREEKVFNSIIGKMENSEDKVKFTKEEKTKLNYQLSENIKHLKKKADSSWFLTRWFYNNMLKQYKSILLIFED